MSSGHFRQKIYKNLGCVNISIEPHFVRRDIPNELIKVSKKYMIYGLCDDSIIIFTNKKVEFYIEKYKLSNGNIEQV